MKVNPSQYSLTVATLKTSDTGQPFPQTDETAPVKKIRPIDPVLGEAQDKMANMPEVDIARVTAMKEAISMGKISINLDELTSSIQSYFQR